MNHSESDNSNTSQQANVSGELEIPQVVTQNDKQQTLSIEPYEPKLLSPTNIISSSMSDSGMSTNSNQSQIQLVIHEGGSSLKVVSSADRCLSVSDESGDDHVLRTGDIGFRVEPISKQGADDKKSTAGQSAATSKTPRSSSVTKSTSGAIRVKTCFGVLELSWLKVFSLLSLTVNLLAFLTLATLIIVGYVGQNYYSTIFDGLDTSTSYYRQMMVASCRSAVFSNNNPQITATYAAKFSNYTKQFLANVDVILTKVPKNLHYYVAHNMSIDDLRTAKALGIESKAISLLKTGNYSSAMSLLESPYYKFCLEGYAEEFQPLVDYVLGIQNFAKDFNTVIITVSLIVILVSVIVVVPTVIGSIVMSLKKDSSNNKKLKQIRALMLMDTMKDTKTRNQFKNYCKQELSLDNFSLLDKINDYKLLSERSFDIQVYLFDTSEGASDILSETGSSSASMEPTKKKKKKGFTEKDLNEIEKKKYEIAFEIYTDYLDVHGDKSVNINKQLADRVKQCLDFFATGQSEHLPENLFENVESEMCVLMMDTFHRFKASLESQKQNKKEILSKFKSNKHKSVNHK
ncbi:hypothetical protein C9374_007672 [Naegleria lovaniensis]|uniref:RGS domain-containing protein n=1 Tax=Naegleria lovaniensis TaxID=51637 RepID=A0AA88KLK9_NAELO|nr:uncharacterized protein C9374_007672 [Naegleria lovaniensis]KAG2379034.1 hypothetical protein C9374_007672 [Naegleria lovaniensis]